MSTSILVSVDVNCKRWTQMPAGAAERGNSIETENG
jgi:hypothetical protein